MIGLEELASAVGSSIGSPIGRGSQVGDRSGSSTGDKISAVEVLDVTHDSRLVEPGTLFCCIRGEHHDGHDHAAEAVSNGAVALLCDHPLAVDVPQLVVEDVRATMSRAASVVWGNPSSRLKVIGVTGTNGKTTVVSMISSILRTAGMEVRMIGTLTGERTTPESSDLQRMLAGFVEEGVEAVAMEVSSHALVQNRVDDVEFDLAVFTNLGRDHLDFHETQESYFSAKSRLFEPGMTVAGVVDVDDIHGRLLHDAGAVPMTPVSLRDVSDLTSGPTGSVFTWRDNRFEVPMVGLHNVANAILAAATCVELGIGMDLVVGGLQNLEQVPGRFEVVEASAGVATELDGVVAVVDYAHTPDALQSVLTAARGIAGDDNRVVVVFGCGGERDREKRPEMGAIASELADVVVVTSDNPRGEDPMSIIEAIVAGIGTAASESSDGEPIGDEPHLIIDPDRRSAIRAGLHAATAGDLVVVAGKGHETGQTIGKRTEPFDDRQVVAELLAEGVEQ